MNYLLCEYNRKDRTASSKARNDAIKIAQDMGYRFIPLYQSKSAKVLVLLNIVKSLIHLIAAAGPGDHVLLQYPYNPMIVNRGIFSALSLGRRIKKYKIQVLIHDISSLRDIEFSGNIPEVIARELALFDNIDAAICHNKAMIDVFHQSGGKGRYFDLSLFDYLTDTPALDKQRDKNRIVIAGNLSKTKCAYIYKLPYAEGISYQLYGVGYVQSERDDIVYQGSFSPEEIVGQLDGGFGLVWDGDSADGCSGNYGNYLRYNNPHKMSLYIAAGIPVIVWKHAAVKDFVLANRIGICADSIQEACDIIRHLGTEEYQNLINNVNEVRNKVTDGFFLRTCLESINAGN